MDFAFLPPEINSGRMYSGPGSGPLLAAAGSWDSLAGELDTMAQTYQSVLSGLTALHWQGPTAAAMLAAATPYIGWLQATAEQAGQTAVQARAAAATYELAHAMTVPPPAVAANRIQLAALVATNFFGQNTAAIAATEAQYAAYWAQDAAAMQSYSAGSAAAAQLLPFTNPDQTTNPAGLPAQSTAAANSLLDLRALQDSLTVSIDPTLINPDNLNILVAIRLVGTAINGTFKMEGTSSGVIGAEHDFGLVPVPVAPQLAAATGLEAGLGSRAGAGLGQVSVTLSRAGTVGRLSVPASWALPSGGSGGALPKGSLASFAAAGEPTGAASGTSGLPGMPGVAASRPSIVVPRYGRRLRVMWPSPATG